MVMACKMTDRMKSWIEGAGCHICLATPDGSPYCIAVRYCKCVSDDIVALALAEDEFAAIEPVFSKNPWISMGVSGLGSIRAAYQFKGTGRVVEGADFDAVAGEATDALGGKPAKVIYVDLKELYCTKPGHVAGQRLDGLGFDDLCKFEVDLGWKDMCPSE
jgi:hypothetical protein